MHSLKYLLPAILIASYGGVANAQTGLQVEFERGFPLQEDGYKEIRPDFVKPISAKAAVDDPNLPWRLPRDIMPEEYDLTITPILDEDVPTLGKPFTAPGEVVIAINVINPTSQIRFHLADVTYITVESTEVVETLTNTNIAITNSEYNAQYQFQTLNLVNPLIVGNMYHIRMTFTANIIDGLHGLYRSRYLDPYTNTTKYIATTQLEALHARQMFPCFDEPSFKAKFFITIGHRRSTTALTATSSSRIRPMLGFPEWVWEDFTGTGIKMPTYLLAIIVSEFTYEEADPSIYNKPVRTYAPAHYIDQDGGVYAAEKAAQLLKFFESHYVERYPLPKMDSAAVPSFFFGAMENYGLNIYRETALLYMPAESTETERFSITRILAHELGHQWFGNQVSCGWWTHIWLNEGFATFLAAQGVAATEVGPEFDALERFQNDAVQNSMGFDARPDYSHSVKIDDNEWINRWAMDWFDRMAYEKAGSLILMMQGFLGADTLRKGLITYLKDMQFQGALQDDLFKRLNDAAHNDSKLPTGLTIKDIMDTWTLQPGFPLLRVSVANANGVVISQERFINDALETPGHINQDTGLWYVPMAIATRSQPNPTEIQWLYKDVAMKYIPANTAQWVVVNAGANGFYRVIYDYALTQLIKTELTSNHGFITSRTRSQLLDDYFNAAWQKHINIETALSLSDYIGNEQEIVVWNTVLNNLRKPFNLLSGAGIFYGSLKGFLLPRLQSAIILTGGIDNPSIPDTKGGMIAIRHLQFMDWLCAFEDVECINYSKRLVDAWAANPAVNNIRRDIKPVAYCTAVAHGSDTAFNFIHSQYILNITLKQQGILLNALACTKEIYLINKLLEETLIDDSGFYNQIGHGATILSQLARNPFARAPMLRFLKENAITPAIVTRLGVASVISSLATYTSTQTELNDIKAYIDEVAIPELTTATQAAIRTIGQNIAWVADFANPMSAYFSMQYNKV